MTKRDKLKKIAEEHLGETLGINWFKDNYPEFILTLDFDTSSQELDEKLIDAYWTKDANGKPQFFNESIKYECLKVEIFDDSKNKYLFNRAIRQFSYFKKTCKKSNKENLYEMTVEYDKNDESEIVIKTLMFGPNIRVIEPSDVIEKISTRISKQDKLFKSL